MKKPPTPTVQCSYRLTPGLKAAIGKATRRLGITENEFVSSALELATTEVTPKVSRQVKKPK